MMELMNRITDKPGWEKKVFDRSITEKWTSEALAAPSIGITERMVNWVGYFAPLSQFLLFAYRTYCISFPCLRLILTLRPL